MYLAELFVKLIEARDAPLYHGIKHDYSISTLQKNRILGTAIQRFSPDGRILSDPDFKHGMNYRFVRRDNPDQFKQEYPKIDSDFERWDKSEWYGGVSLTRSLPFAASWAIGGIVLKLDQSKLVQRYKVIPWNWGSSKNKYKKEQEEFVVLGRTDRQTSAFNRKN